MFEKYYKQHLAKRLLHGRTSSDDAGAPRCALRALRALRPRPALPAARAPRRRCALLQLGRLEFLAACARSCARPCCAICRWPEAAVLDGAALHSASPPPKRNPPIMLYAPLQSARCW